MQQKPQLGAEQHMQALTELRQYVRAEQNRPVLGASKQSMQGGGPATGGLSAILSHMMGQGGDPGVQQLMGNMGRSLGGLPAPKTSGVAAGRPPEGESGPGTNPGSISALQQPRGGLIPMPGRGGYSGLRGGMR